jgi:hypothetical protein
MAAAWGVVIVVGVGAIDGRGAPDADGEGDGVVVVTEGAQAAANRAPTATRVSQVRRERSGSRVCIMAQRR